MAAAKGDESNDFRSIGQYNGKGSISLVYASKPQVTEQLFIRGLQINRGVFKENDTNQQHLRTK